MARSAFVILLTRSSKTKEKLDDACAPAGLTQLRKSRGV
jgi:hypothetical protein